MGTLIALNLGAPELLVLVVVLGVTAVPLLVIALLATAARRNR
jgi:hypothetical protein